MPGRAEAGKIALILCLCGILVVMRIPPILAGRLWAEEGTVFFAYAWDHTPLDALFYPYGGYLNLVANAAALLARWCVPLEVAPAVTIAIALLFQLVPPLLLLLGRDPWLRDWRVRSAGVLLLLFVPAADEIWLQTLHCQFELTIAAGIVLALEVPRGARSAVSLAVLALAPLCGPGAVALVPLFLLRLALERSAARAAQAAILAAAAGLQLGWFYHPIGDRHLTTDPATLLTLVSVKHLVLPFLGMHAAIADAPGWQEALAAGRVPIRPVLAAAAGAAGLAACLAWMRNATGAWLFAAACLVGGVSYVGALDGGLALISPFVGARYAIAPQSLLALVLLALASQAGRLRPVAALACAWLLIVGIQQYRRPLVMSVQGPDWRAEIAAWRADPSHPIRLWPAPWTMSLRSGTE